MALTSRVWGAGKLPALRAARGPPYLLPAFLAVRMSVRASEVTVPDLTGRSVNDASARLEDLGLTLRVDENRRTDQKIPAGSVVQQDPIPGSHVRRQRSIHVWVSQGEEGIVVPPPVGD